MKTHIVNLFAPPYSPLTSSENDTCDVVPDEQETAQKVTSTVKKVMHILCAWLTISIHSGVP